MKEVPEKQIKFDLKAYTFRNATKDDLAGPAAFIASPHILPTNVGSQRLISIVNLAVKYGQFLYFLMRHRCPLSDTHPSKITADILLPDAPQSRSLKARLRLWVATTL